MLIVPSVSRKHSLAHFTIVILCTTRRITINLKYNLEADGIVINGVLDRVLPCSLNFGNPVIVIQAFG